MAKKLFQLLLLCLGTQVCCMAQIIHGEVYDIETKQSVADGNIENIHTSFAVTSGNNGSFLIAATNDQLLEFKKQGFKTTRVRIPKGFIPPYFKIGMHKGYIAPSDVRQQNNRYSYRDDSIQSHELYKHELDFPKMTSYEMIQHPFSAMSKKNNEIWRFQEEFNFTEKEKYVDRTFNDNLISKLTGLTGDSLHKYIYRFKPEYEQLRKMSDYSLFYYIKQTVNSYRHPTKSSSAQ